MKISIAMATYNGEKYIERQLQTILQQTVQVDEIIICDDCSKDSTVNIIRKIMKKTEKNIIKLVINKENIGYIGNFYKAISLTSGDYIFLADQDDEWHLDKIEKTIKIMKKLKATVVCSNFSLIDQNSDPIENTTLYKINPFVNKAIKKITPVSFNQLVFGNIAQGCTYCFTKEVRDVYLKVNSKQLIHDHQIMFIATLLGKAFFYNEKLIDYRIHPNNVIGFEKKSDKVKIGLKKPSKKPFMVQFMDELDCVQKVPYKGYYKMLYYMRIPYIISKFRK